MYFNDICRSKITEGELMLVHNIAKLKKIPGTKDQPKYKGPYEVTKITDSHAYGCEDNNQYKKSKKFPLHMTIKYFQRDTQVFIITILHLHFSFIVSIIL